MAKITLVFSCLFLLVLPFVSSQLDGAGEQIQEAAENLEKNVSKIREFTEADKWNFLGDQWKEILLKSKVISGLDVFFTKINLLFVILFGMDWSLSMQMYFSFLLWIALVYSLLKIKVFSNNKVGRFLYILSVFFIIPLTQIYEYVGKFAVAAVFYNSSTTWKLISFILLTSLFMALIGLFGIVGSYYKKFKESREKKQEQENRNQLKKVVAATQKEVSERFVDREI